MIAADDLVAGKQYVFCYRAIDGKIRKESGTYLRMTVEHNVLWIWFDVEAGEVPWEYGCFTDVREV